MQSTPNSKKELCVKLFLWSNEIERKQKNIWKQKKNDGTTYLYEWIFSSKEHLKKKEVSQTKTHEYRLAPYK